MLKHMPDSISASCFRCKPYMAPERINPMGDKSYDIRSDVWSLGISMIEIATGGCCDGVYRAGSVCNGTTEVNLGYILTE